MATERNNIFLRARSPEFLRKMAEMGYLKADEAFNISKFARFTLPNNSTRLCASFNNLNPFLDTPTQLYVVSTSAADTQAIRIYYIDQNRDAQEIDVVLSGQTAVPLGTDIYCVWRMVNISSQDVVGKVSVTSNAAPAGGNPADNTVYGQIPAPSYLTLGVPLNQSQTTVYSIPRGFTGFLTQVTAGANKSADMTAGAFIRAQGGVFRYVTTLDVFQTSKVKTDFARLPGGTDIKPLARAQTGGEAFVDYELLVIKTALLDRFRKKVV